jgi:hypothetical protein
MAPLPWRFAALVSLLAAFAGALALRLRRALRRHRSRLDELHDRLRQASELAEARQRYVAQLGHEARNLVANITGTLALADRAPDPLALRRVVQALRANARGLQDLLDASLDAAQLDAGRFAVRPVCVDLPRLLDDLSAEVAPLTRGGAVLVGIEGELAIATCWQLDGVRLAQIVRCEGAGPRAAGPQSHRLALVPARHRPRAGHGPRAAAAAVHRLRPCRRGGRRRRPGAGGVAPARAGDGRRPAGLQRGRTGDHLLPVAAGADAEFSHFRHGSSGTRHGFLEWPRRHRLWTRFP